jgi:hypothetical protein
VWLAETYLTSVARLLVCLLVAFSYPLQAHPARKCILTLAAKLLDREYQEGAHDEDSADRRSAARGGAVAVPTQSASEREQTRFLGITVSKQTKPVLSKSRFYALRELTLHCCGCCCCRHVFWACLCLSG